MKKVLSVLLAALLIVSMFGCAAAPAAQPAAPAAQEEAAPAAPAEEAQEEAAPAEEASDALPFEGVELQYWWAPYTTQEMGDIEYWDMQFEKFTEQTGATVKVTVVPWDDLSTKYMAGFMSGEGPDVFYMTSDITYDIAESGALLNLTPYFSADEIANQNYWKSGYCVGDDVYTVPIYGGCDFRNFAFNKDLLAAAGVDTIPETWDEVIDAAVKVKEAGVCEYPILFPMNTVPIFCYLPLLWSAGGEVVNADGTEALLDSPESLAAAQFIYDLANTYEVLSEDCVSMTGTAGCELFGEGKVAMAEVMPAWCTVNYETFDFDWTSVAAIHKEGCEPRCFSAFDSMAVNANSKNLDAAVALLKFVISTEQREEFRKVMVPDVAAMNADMEPTEYPIDHIADQVSKIAEYGKQTPVCKGYTAISDAMMTNQQLLVLGELTPEEACQALQESATVALEG